MAAAVCGHCAAGTQTFSAQRVPLAAGGGRGSAIGTLKTKFGIVVGRLVIWITVVVFQPKRCQEV
eukprot:scaffold19217_cov61-Phaeocystis_antarctica.AAC.2